MATSSPAAARAIGTGAAAIGLLGVTMLALARPIADLHPLLLLGAVAVFAAELRGVHPIMLIAGATLIGAASTLIIPG
jgi:hypothetical protein